MNLPPVGIIGSGALARALGHALLDAGVEIALVASGDPARAASAASSIRTGLLATDIAAVPALTSHVIVATADSKIGSYAASLAAAGFRGGCVVHTCGATGPAVLAPLAAAGTACGVLHPLQSVTNHRTTPDLFKGVAFGIAGDQRAVAFARDVVAALGGRALTLDANAFALYHAGAVLASNAIPALLDAATQLFVRAGVLEADARPALAPLMTTSVENAIALGPSAALTGPIARGDVDTIRRHLSALCDTTPQIDGLYRAVSRCLVDLARERGLASTTLDALVAALDSPRPGEPS